MELSEIVKGIRQAMGISQKELGQIISSNQTEISFIERGFVPNDQEKIEKLYALYNNLRKD